jgi:hypothetical protein
MRSISVERGSPEHAARTSLARSCILGTKAGCATMSSERRELYRSPNGDSWFLARALTDGRAFIIHQPISPSGGRLSHIGLATFLKQQTRGSGTSSLPAPDRNAGGRFPVWPLDLRRKGALRRVMGSRAHSPS